jgi:NhaC family Na+:H+ antiporter
LIQPILKWAQGDKRLLVATGLTSIGINMVAGDQYMAIVLPGRMFRNVYPERNLAPENLSRQIEGSGTVSSPLIPWNSCGAYMSATLGIATAAYLPFAFFNIIDIVITFLFAILGVKIARIKPEETIQESPEEAVWRDIGGQRVKPTEHELAVTQG